MAATSAPSLRGGVENVTRREFVLGGAALAALVTAGCGSGGGSEGSTGPGGADSRTVAGVLDNRYTFDAPPKRVFGDLDVVASLGVVPVGTELYAGMAWADYQKDVLDPSTTVVPYSDGPDFEAIAATRPDLILTAFSDETYHKTLAEIAPTIFIDNQKPWREVIRAASVPLFREAEAERAIGEVELAFEEFQRSHPDRAGTTPCAFYVDTDGTLTILTKESPLSALFEEAGFAPMARSGDPYGDPVSEELVTEVATGDFLMVFLGQWRLDDPDEPVPAEVQTRLDSPLFASAPAAAGGTFVFPDEGGRAAYYFSPLYLPTWIEHLDATLS